MHLFPLLAIEKREECYKTSKQKVNPTIPLWTTTGCVFRAISSLGVVFQGKFPYILTQRLISHLESKGPAKKSMPFSTTTLTPKYKKS